MYIPKWVPIIQAINHVRAVQGLSPPDAEHLLVLALRDKDVKARNAHTGKPLKPDGWRAVALHPVHMPELFSIEICVRDLLRHWPEQSGAHRIASVEMMNRYSVPAVIPASAALSQTIDFLREADRFNRTDVGRSLREEIVHAVLLNLTEGAIECLRTACAASNLTMLVVDPNGGQRHDVPAGYFDQRDFAGLEFSSATFRGCDRSDLVFADPFLKHVHPFCGWAHGFIEQAFRAWLKDPAVGPLAGPTMRPFFHISAISKADRSEDAATQGDAVSDQRNSDAKKGRVPTKRGALACWIARNYSAGLPPGAKIIAGDYRRATGITVSVRSVRRALGGR